ncbi:hypothetical protein Y032_0118g725 [Ancylostoma ceylanicum]|uniref:Uncharacterized protein n=1 Tax=Ancylostoma ceylanicum TaxID=53326 RepID=A0A016TBI3_9BILA|nr:hypothetical protein Y032_0118g725 [Ancylostoma ceylanicum]
MVVNHGFGLKAHSNPSTTVVKSHDTTKNSFQNNLPREQWKCDHPSMYCAAMASNDILCTIKWLVTIQS